MPPISVLGASDGLVASERFRRMLAEIPDLLLTIRALELMHRRQVKTFVPVDALGSHFRAGLAPDQVLERSDVTPMPKPSLVAQMFGLRQTDGRSDWWLQLTAWAILDHILTSGENSLGNTIDCLYESVEVYWLVRPTEEGIGWVSWQNPEALRSQAEFDRANALITAVLDNVRAAKSWADTDVATLDDGDDKRAAEREAELWGWLEVRFERRLCDLVYREPEPSGGGG